MDSLIKSSKVSKPNLAGDAVRATIPFEIAKALGWKAGDELVWKALPKSKAVLVFKMKDSLIKLEDQPQLKTEIQEVNSNGNKE